VQGGNPNCGISGTYKKAMQGIFFGDPICFGQGISPDRVWVARIASHPAVTFPDFGFSVQNPSVNGNTIRLALERMPYDVQAHCPHILIIQFGMNDCNVWETDRGHQRVSPEGFVANLCEIINRGRLCGAKELLLGVNHPTTRTTSRLPHTDFTYEQSNRKYNALVREIARSTNVQIVDMERHVDAAVQRGGCS
jgi:lysophospholipase L1-like esterase